VHAHQIRGLIQERNKHVPVSLGIYAHHVGNGLNGLHQPHRFTTQQGSRLAVLNRSVLSEIAKAKAYKELALGDLILKSGDQVWDLQLHYACRLRPFHFANRMESQPTT
jgi:hypothetical protein